MQVRTFTITLLSLFIVISFAGCGGDSGSSAQTTPSASNAMPSTKTITTTKNSLSMDSLGYEDLFQLVDNQTDNTALVLNAQGIKGLRVTCGGQETVTGQYGLFTCNTLPLNIYLGDFKIGTLPNIPKDKIIYTQDILHLPRAATMHPDVTKLSMILQSLDEDANLDNGIEITQESMDLLDNELANFKNIQELTIADVSNIIDNVIAARKANDSQVHLTKVTEKEAQINLTEALANTPAKSLNVTSFRSIAL